MMKQTMYAAGAGLMICSGAAIADVVHFTSDANTTTNSSWTGASLTGSIEYNHTGGNLGQLVFSLTNTTDASVGGFLTGFVFNIASSDSNAMATLSSTDVGVFQNTGTQAAQPFGIFDAGAAVGANWQGGGRPSQGLAAGLSGLFTFTVKANDAGSLSAISFMGDGDDIALRFRGLADGGSDKLLVNEEQPLNVVPLPKGVLAGGAMLGLGLGVRRMRNRK